MSIREPAIATHIGIDLVAVTEVRRAIAVHGERYLGRVYTERELTEARRSPRLLAACFAAKEATMKALRRQDQAIGWQSIELTVGTRELTPAIRLSGAAAALARDRQIRRVSVAITNRRDHAAAIVTTKGGR